MGNFNQYQLLKINSNENETGFNHSHVTDFCVITPAQNTIPAGYAKATIVLDNGNSLSGYVKDNIKNTC